MRDVHSKLHCKWNKVLFCTAWVPVRNDIYSVLCPASNFGVSTARLCVVRQNLDIQESRDTLLILELQNCMKSTPKSTTFSIGCRAVHLHFLKCNFDSLGVQSSPTGELPFIYYVQCLLYQERIISQISVNVYCFYAIELLWLHRSINLCICGPEEKLHWYCLVIE